MNKRKRVADRKHRLKRKKTEAQAIAKKVEEVVVLHPPRPSRRRSGTPPTA